MTDWQYQVWLAWLEDSYKQGKDKDPPEISMEGCVPEETQRRWAEKVQVAPYIAASYAASRNREAQRT